MHMTTSKRGIRIHCLYSIQTVDPRLKAGVRQPLNSCTECKLRVLDVKHQAESASQCVIDRPLILCDAITPLPVNHMVNIERGEVEY